jgi:hypothetical protein
MSERKKKTTRQQGRIKNKPEQSVFTSNFQVYHHPLVVGGKWKMCEGVSGVHFRRNIFALFTFLRLVQNERYQHCLTATFFRFAPANPTVLKQTRAARARSGTNLLFLCFGNMFSMSGFIQNACRPIFEQRI